MLINKKMHEARVKAIRDAVNDETNVYYIFRQEQSRTDGETQWCETTITQDLDDIKARVNGIKKFVDEFELITDLDEFEKGDAKKVRGFTPIFVAVVTSKAEILRPMMYAGYIRKIEKERK